MKNIIRFKNVKPEGNVTLDYYNDAFREFDIEEIIKMYLPYSRLFEHITIKNFTTLPETLIKALTNQYIHGAEIIITTPQRKFNKSYSVRHPAKFYAYKWEPLDLKKPIPKSLAEFRFIYQGKSVTYLDAIKTLTSTAFLPNEIWNALDVYSKSQIDKCREYNKGDYSLAEDWYKELMHDCYDSGLKMYSPNPKTYYEVTAEREFDKFCEADRLPEGLRPLNDNELCFLRKYAPIYGVEIPTFKWKFNSRKTDAGYTQEPEYVTCGTSTVDWTHIIFDKRNDNLPKFVRQGMVVRENKSDKKLREAYFQLTWLIKNLGDKALMPNYHRCPECHEIYHEVDGCPCGYCKGVRVTDADNLFYGIHNTYEDYDNTIDAYNRELED